jgi:hypothetical protein
MKSEHLGVWIGAIAAVALVILYISQSEQSGGTKIEPVFQVSGTSPEVAAIRSSERIAKLNANKDTVLGWFALQLGLKQTDASKELGILQSNNEVKIAESVSKAQLEMAKQSGLTAVQLAAYDAEARKFIAKQAADAAKKGKNINAISGLVQSGTSFLDKILGLFGK